MKAWHHDRRLVLATCCFNLVQPLLRCLLLLCFFFFLTNKKFMEWSSGDSRNFVQGVPISLWKNFETFQSISSVSKRFGKYRSKFKIWPAWSLCFKKKKFLKPKQICIMYTEKSQKAKKKKIEMKWNVQSYLLYNKL